MKIASISRRFGNYTYTLERFIRSNGTAYNTLFEDFNSDTPILYADGKLGLDNPEYWGKAIINWTHQVLISWRRAGIKI